MREFLVTFVLVGAVAFVFFQLHPEQLAVVVNWIMAQI
jgi:hypothetical protein